ncbi:MAG: D-glycero-beta-D-manno-heptose-7-phosphate kinase [Euryarchaeota archaeon]|nr:D-glycero-beta-D-manno-heptose-7-phosphate kinase [Euryarchaeota archaeon]
MTKIFNIDFAELNQLVDNFRRMKILVIGDLMLDEYIWGEVERISPEAPVPVVRVASESWVPGGAANVAHNIRALGGRVSVAGVIGRDQAGARLKRLLKKSGIDIRGVIAAAGRPTVTKSRVLAEHQQVLRVDREDLSPIRKGDSRRLLKTLREIIDGLDAVILEDYAKGVIDQSLVDEVIRLAGSRVLVVDPNRDNFLKLRGATIATPNKKEAYAAAGAGRADPLEKVGRILLKKWAADSVLITLGEDGICLFERRKKAYYIPTLAREVYDVSGAGDTVAGTLALALAAGATLRQAAYLANCAAGVVVGKVGTATASSRELRSCFLPR